MVEKISGRKFYQLTTTNTYKQAFKQGQRILVGEVFNPFFSFYETVLTYPITDHVTGNTIQVNAVDWLYRVRAGTISTNYPILVEKAWEVSQHYMMLARELLMEEIRVNEFDRAPPSRQTCLYLSDSIEEAKTWTHLLGGTGYICELICTGVIHRADSRQMVMRSEALSVTKECARAYWRGEISGEPRMETLFVGDAVVSAVGL